MVLLLNFEIGDEQRAQDRPAQDIIGALTGAEVLVPELVPKADTQESPRISATVPASDLTTLIGPVNDERDAAEQGHRGEQEIRPASFLSSAHLGKHGNFGNLTKLDAQPLELALGRFVIPGSRTGGLFGACAPPTHRAVQGVRKDVLHTLGPLGFRPTGDMNGG